MGQSSSSEAQSRAQTVTATELSKLFAESCSKQFSPIELFTIQQNMKLHDKDQNQLINESEFEEMIDLPKDPNQAHGIYELVRTLSQFPFINHDVDSVTFSGILKAIVLINKERCGSVLGKNYDYLKLVFICFYSTDLKEPVNKEETFDLVVKPDGTPQWANTPIVQSFDTIEINELKVPAKKLLNIVTFLIIIARLESHESLSLFLKNFKHFDQYKEHALPIIRAMDPEITMSTVEQFEIGYKQFSNAIETVAFNLLDPLSTLLEVLLFDQKIEIVNEKEVSSEAVPLKSKHISASTRLVNEFSLSQLSTILRKELVFSNIRKLYIGGESGFSMRSFESKVFKWMAPSILILKGKRVSSQSKNPRYLKFDEDFPRFKQGLLSSQHENDIITFGVYINQPWRITNKDTFGDEQTEIFQLSPVQRIFKTGLSTKNHIYFNTLGGGIGIGNQQPLIKNNAKRYHPGNVSLTIDQSLEFAVFRHLGIGGEFKSVDEKDWYLEYEERFLISDVEVWGCGGEKELEEQNKRWEWEQREAKRRQQVNLKSIGEDRALLEMAGIIGGHQSGGSV